MVAERNQVTIDWLVRKSFASGIGPHRLSAVRNLRDIGHHVKF